MFATDWIFSSQLTPAEFNAELTELCLTADQAEQYIEVLKCFGGAACMAVTREYLVASVTNRDMPHWAKRSPGAVGRTVLYVDFFGLTPDEELAIMAHEMGHALCGHEPEGDWTTNEYEADWFAATSVGVQHIHSALTKMGNAMGVLGHLKPRLDRLAKYL